MRKSALQEQLVAYKKKVRRFLQRCAEIEENIEAAYESYGDDHQGSLDWLPHQLKWRKDIERALACGALDFNLSLREIENIWKSALQEIGCRNRD